ncbi:MAG TPA: outer membrane protein assembly factor BamA [Thermoanaerobaculia bacterium]|nr:outer membrane protein assembly factor BamA [Thermoanaerobaculia bacterium]
MSPERATRAGLIRSGIAGLAILLASSPLCAQFEFRGLVVRDIAIRPDAPIDEPLVRELIAIQPGEPLSIAAVQSTIKRLYGTGDFRDIRIEGDTAGDGTVDIALILSLSYRIATLAIEGAGDDRDRARREVLIRVGDVLSLDAVDRSAVAIQQMFARRGHLAASVDPETRFEREQNLADVIFHVTPGPQATIAAVEIDGETAPFTREQIIDAMRVQPGDAFRPDRARRAADRVRAFLSRRDHRRADVRYLGETHDPETDQVTLRYRVNTGPIVRVEVTGVPRRSVRRLLPFGRDDEYSEDLIHRSASRMVTELQSRGHFLAAVDTEERLEGNEWIVEFQVRPGPVYRLSSVEFQGNSQISEAQLRDVVQIHRRGGFRSVIAGLFRRPTGLTQEMLAQDRDALEAFYRTRGFTEVEIRQPVAAPFPDQSLVVTFPILEGPQTVLTEVRLEGNEVISTARLPNPKLTTGSPLNPILLTGDIIALQTYYAVRGYVEVQVAPRITFTSDKTGAELIYSITEGPQVNVDQIIVRGNTYTDRDVILKKVSIEKGDPFSYRSIYQAQRDLYRLGIFQRVDLIPEQAGTNVGLRNIVVQVEEGRNLTIAGSVGYSTDQGARGSVSVFHRNLFGSARYLGVEARISQREDRYVLTYREPFIFNYDIPTQLTIFRAEERAGRVRDAEFQRLGTFIEASRVVGLRQRWALRYEYKVTRCVRGAVCEAATGDIPIPGLPLEDQEVQISSLSPTWFWDSRDDPINPSRGLFASSTLEYAFPLFQAETQFLKAVEHATWYRPLSERTLVALSVRIGLIEPLGRNEVEQTVPISERLYAGGELTHRAFELDSLGIEGETIVCLRPSEVENGPPEVIPCSEGGRLTALGGKGMVLLNAEYRFPIFASLSGALFVDAGNVWRTIGDIDTGDLRYGAGVGARYLTPVGPLRVDIGFKLDREAFEDPYAVFVTLGFPF